MRSRQATKAGLQAEIKAPTTRTHIHAHVHTHTQINFVKPICICDQNPRKVSLKPTTVQVLSD